MNKIGIFGWIAAAGLLTPLAGCDEGALSGTTSGLSAAQASGVDFGHVYIGETGTVTVRLTATGTGSTRLSGAQVSPALISVTPDLDGMTVWPGEPLDVTLRWTPQVAGVIGGGGLLVNSGDVDTVVVAIAGEAMPVPDCNDGNSCTQDEFDFALGACAHAVLEETTCDDGNACTQSDRCEAGRCVGAAVACDDGNGCTLDSCNPTDGCVHAENPDACDDGNPCTADVCLTGGGCEYGFLGDGMVCGVPDCAQALLCVSGSCEAFDISNTSDGMSCNDGDSCTSGDVCLDGVCGGGELVQVAPAVVANHPTFGGADSSVATDGYRYLFTAADAVHIAVPDATGELVVTATLPALPRSQPVTLGPGRFAYAASYSMYIVDATNENAPVQYYAGPSPFDTVRELHAVDGGLVVYGEEGSPHIEYMHLQADLVSFTSLPLVFGLFTDIDAHHDVLVAMSIDSVSWYRFDTLGLIVESHSFGAWDLLGNFDNIFDEVWSWDRVSVWGRRIGLLAGAFVTTVNIPAPVGCVAAPNPEPTCAYYLPTGNPGQTIPSAGQYLACGPDPTGVPCMPGTGCRTVYADACPASAIGCPGQVDLCLPPLPAVEFEISLFQQANDIVVTDQVLATVGRDGTYAHDLWYDAFTPNYVDAMPAQRVERGPNHLLLRGSIAMPLISYDNMLYSNVPVNDGPDNDSGIAIQIIQFTPVTGPLHGDLWGVAPSGDTVGVSGLVSMGTYSRTADAITDWKAESLVATEQHIRVLKGDTRSVGLPRARVGSLPALCGLEFTSFDSALSPIEHGWLCGATSGRYAVSNDTLWAYGPWSVDPVPSQPEGVLLRYSLSGALPAAQFAIHAEDRSNDSTVRLTDDGEQVALVVVPFVNALFAPMNVTLIATSPGATPESFPPFTLTMNGLITGEEVAVDGRSMLAASWSSLTLVDLDNPGAPLEYFVPWNFYNQPRVLWMDEGRAWVAWSGGLDVNYDTAIPIGTDTGDEGMDSNEDNGAMAPPNEQDMILLVDAHYLTEFRYAAGELEELGSIELPSPARDVAVVDGEVFAVTDTGLHVVQSSCQ